MMIVKLIMMMTSMMLSTKWMMMMKMLGRNTALFATAEKIK